VKPYQEHGPQRHNRPQHHGLGLLDSRLGISHHRRLDGGGARGAARGGRLGAQREGVGLGDGEHLGGFGGSGVGCAKDGRALRRSSGEVFVGPKPGAQERIRKQVGGLLTQEILQLLQTLNYKP